MKFVFRLGGLVLVLLVVGWLAKSQLSGQPSKSKSTDPTVSVPAGTPQQIQQQYKEALEQAMQPQRSERTDP